MLLTVTVWDVMAGLRAEKFQKKKATCALCLLLLGLGCGLVSFQVLLTSPRTVNDDFRFRLLVNLDFGRFITDLVVIFLGGLGDSPVSDVGFRVMALMFRVRDFFRPRRYIVEEVGVREGFRVLDYGCGPGGYVKAVAELVGRSGRIYALDVEPLALDMVKKIAVKEGLLNVETILSDCKTGLADDSLDVVLLYDVFHHLRDSGCVLSELHRVLKPGGILSFSDHHMEENEIVSSLTKSGQFKLLKKGKRTYSFGKFE